jgi:3-deoxy-D-manno-octulosonate 8-phosphate phosphatase (KDO 8-P phosphatase)
VDLGGVLLTEAQALSSRLGSIRGLVFDWDGVFNPGTKGPGVASTFSEADSMGTNMLRYALWRRTEMLPISAVITGEVNPGAELFACREHFSALYQGEKNKGDAVDRVCREHDLSRRQLVCVFDDINDLAMASGCGVRVLVRRDASPALREYVERERLCDYITGAEAGSHAVRETAELLLGLMGDFGSVVGSRIASDDAYRSYFAARQSVQTQVCSLES